MATMTSFLEFSSLRFCKSWHEWGRSTTKDHDGLQWEADTSSMLFHGDILLLLPTCSLDCLSRDFTINTRRRNIQTTTILPALAIRTVSLLYKSLILHHSQWFWMSATVFPKCFVNSSNSGYAKIYFLQLSYWILHYTAKVSLLR
jgi:hypothetical protein